MSLLLLLAIVSMRTARADVPPPELPYEQPAYVQPLPLPLLPDANDLARRGRQKKIAGGVLMGVGAALSVVGIALALDAALGRAPIECSGHEEHVSCTPSPAVSEMQAGYGAAVLGNLVLVAGIPVYIVGAVQSAKAKRLGAQLAFAPLLGNGGSGATARLTFRF